MSQFPLQSHNEEEMFDNENDHEIEETGDSGDENSRGHVGDHDTVGDHNPMGNGTGIMSGLGGSLGPLTAPFMLPNNAQGLDLSEQHNSHYLHHSADVLEKLKMQVRDIKVDRVSLLFSRNQRLFN